MRAQFSNLKIIYFYCYSVTLKRMEGGGDRENHPVIKLVKHIYGPSERIKTFKRLEISKDRIISIDSYFLFIHEIPPTPPFTPPRTKCNHMQSIQSFLVVLIK